MKKETCRRIKQNLAATISQDTFLLPLADQAAYREGRDVRGTGRLPVFGIELESSRNFFANGSRKEHQGNGPGRADR